MFFFYLSENYWKIRKSSTESRFLVSIIIYLLNIMRKYCTENVKLFSSDAAKSTSPPKCNCQCNCYQYYKTTIIKDRQTERLVESPMRGRQRRADAFTKAFKNIKAIASGYRNANQIEKCVNEKREKPENREKPHKWVNTILKCTCDQSVISVTKRGVNTNVITISSKTDANNSKNRRNVAIDWFKGRTRDVQSACTCGPDQNLSPRSDSSQSVEPSPTDSYSEKSSSSLVSVSLARFHEDFSLDYEVSLSCF